MERRVLRWGMVGGDLNAFIGDVHRKACAMNENAVLVCGSFSRHADRNQAVGLHYGLDPERVYPDYETMAAQEAAREDGIDWVSICTPNDSHYPIAKAFLERGIHVYCEKPLTFTVEQAEELKALAEEKGLLFGVNYSHSGNVMVHEARELVRSGAIGELINVNCEYFQEYLVDDIGNQDTEMLQLSSWRKDPEISGGSNCVGDICSHIEHTVSFITGMKLKRVCALLDTYGQPLDLNANILVEFENGCHGVFASSQVCIGHMNGLVVRLFGTKGAIEWVQEEPNTLKLTKKGQPTQILNRGMGYISPVAAGMERLPFGHPEGLYEAFANMYRAFTYALLKKVNGEELTCEDLDFPNVDDGIRGVRFITASLKSSRNGAVWTEV